MKLLKLKLTEVHRQENSRSDDFDYSELMESIKSSGLIQPVVVCKNFYTTTGKPYVLVAGNRRYAAMKRLGVSTITAVLNSSIKNEADLLIFNMAENLQRRDVSALEQGRLIQLLIKKHKLTANECAARLGLPTRRIDAMLKAFLTIPGRFAHKVVVNSTGQEKGTIPLGIAKEVANLRKSNLIKRREMTEILDKVVNEELTHHHVKEITSKIKSGYSYESVKQGLKKVVYISCRIPVYANERDLIEGGMHNFLEQLLYGETNDAFTRPRFK